jgi:hypothetical protein
MGKDCPAATPRQEEDRIAVLRTTVETYLPEFAKGVAAVAGQAKDAMECPILLHQDAFAAGYDDDEYTLLGMAVKYAGLHGVGIRIVGTNHETF